MVADRGGVNVTPRDRTPDAYARQLGRDIDKAMSDSDGRRAVVSRKLRTVLYESGRWKRRGTDNIQQIIDAHARHKIHCDRDLADARLSLDSFVSFGRRPIRLRDVAPTPFASEPELVDFIVEHHDSLFRGYPELRNLTPAGTEVEYRLGPKETRPDIVFKTSNGGLVVVEVELGDPQENSAFQLRTYMRNTGAKLGVLFTARPSSTDLEETVLDALEDMADRHRTFWMWYGLKTEKLR